MMPSMISTLILLLVLPFQSGPSKSLWNWQPYHSLHFHFFSDSLALAICPSNARISAVIHGGRKQSCWSLVKYSVSNGQESHGKHDLKSRMSNRWLLLTIVGIRQSLPTYVRHTGDARVSRLSQLAQICCGGTPRDEDELSAHTKTRHPGQRTVWLTSSPLHLSLALFRKRIALHRTTPSNPMTLHNGAYHQAPQFGGNIGRVVIILFSWQKCLYVQLLKGQIIVPIVNSRHQLSC